MSKISVVYWSQSGNTAAMAEAVAKGVTDAGKEAEIVFVSSASIDELKSETAFALGCPAMGAEVLEEGEMEPFVTELEGCMAGISSVSILAMCSQLMLILLSSTGGRKCS